MIKKQVQWYKKMMLVFKEQNNLMWCLQRQTSKKDEWVTISCQHFTLTFTQHEFFMGRLQFSQQGGHNYLLLKITGIASWVSSRLFSELSTCDRIIHDVCLNRLSD